MGDHHDTKTGDLCDRVREVYISRSTNGDSDAAAAASRPNHPPAVLNPLRDERSNNQSHDDDPASSPTSPSALSPTRLASIFSPSPSRNNSNASIAPLKASPGASASFPSPPGGASSGGAAAPAATASTASSAAKQLGDVGPRKYFCSYVQNESRSVALELYYQFKNEVWLDSKRADCSQPEMVLGVKNCGVFFCVLSEGYARSTFCVMELTHAVTLGKPIVLIHHNKALPFGAIFGKLPKILRSLQNRGSKLFIDSNPAQLDASIQDIKVESLKLLKKVEMNASTTTFSIVTIDCGTGQSKAMLWTYFPEGMDGQFVDCRQLSADLPPVRDFLKGTVVPRNWAFLGNRYNPESGPTLKLQHFVDFCKLVKRHIPNTRDVIVGMSQWSHNEELRGKAQQLMRQLHEEGFTCIALDGQQEAYFETASVGYAHARMQSSENTTPLAACISGGSGSSQFAYNMKHVLSMEQGTASLTDNLMDTYLRKQRFDEAFDDLNKAANGTTDCSIARFIMSRKLEVAGNIADPKEREKFLQPCKGDIIAIAACYYAAKNARIETDDKAMIFHPLSAVMDQMHEKQRNMQQKLLDGNIPPHSDLRLFLRSIANLALHRTMFAVLMDREEARICFKRNWSINSEAFRTTWTSGYFLDYLERVEQVTFPGSTVVLQHYRQWDVARAVACTANCTDSAPNAAADVMP